MQTPNNSLFAVFKAISSEGEISRREISQRTGFSQVTVGKNVDILEKAEVVSRFKKDSTGVGRKGDICVIEKSFGMLLFDLSQKAPEMKVYDMALKCLGSVKGDSASDIILKGFEKLTELGILRLAGIGVICPFGKKEEAENIFLNAFGNLPDILTEECYAHANANLQVFDSYNMGIFARIFADGKGDVVIVNSGSLHLGVGGRAGIFRNGESATEFAYKIADIGKIMDVSSIHIACDEENMCGEIRYLLKKSFSENKFVKISVEFMESLDTPMNGLAMMTRDKFLSKLLPGQ